MTYSVQLYEDAYTDLIKVQYSGITEARLDEGALFVYGKDLTEVIPLHAFGRACITEEKD